MALPPGCFMTNAGSKGCRPYVWEATNVTSFFLYTFEHWCWYSVQFELPSSCIRCLYLMAVDHSFLDATCKNSHLFNESKTSCANVFFFCVCVKDEKKVKNTMKRQFDGVVLKLISCYWRIKSVPSPYIDHWPSTNHCDYKSAWRE